MSKQTVNDAIALEAELDKLLPQVPLGGLVRNTIGDQLKGINRNHKSVLFLTIHSLLRRNHTQPALEKAGHVFFIQNSNKYHFQTMIQPLYAHYKESAEWVMVEEKRYMGKKVPDFFNPIGLKDLIKSLSLTRQCKAIQKKAKQAGWKFDVTTLRRDLFVNLLYYYRALRWLEKTKPRVVVTDFDRGNMVAAPVCLAAKKLSFVTTITQQHGSIDFLYSYYPPLADIFFSWGQLSTESLTRAGIDKKRVIEVGNPIAKNYHFDEDKPLKRALGISLAYNEPEENRKLLDMLSHEPSLKEFRLIIKLRPSKKPDAWLQKLDRFEIFETESGINVNEAFFDQIDILVNSFSSVGPEAVAAGVPLWIYKVTNEWNKVDYQLTQSPHFPDIARPGVLTEELEKLDTNPSVYLKEMWDQQAAVVRAKYYKKGDEEAHENMIQVIDGLLENGKS